MGTEPALVFAGVFAVLMLLCEFIMLVLDMEAWKQRALPGLITASMELNGPIEESHRPKADPADMALLHTLEVVARGGRHVRYGGDIAGHRHAE